MPSRGQVVRWATTAGAVGGWRRDSTQIRKAATPIRGSVVCPYACRKISCSASIASVKNLNEANGLTWRGLWRMGGWSHYYAAAALWKMPEGYLLLLGISLLDRVRALRARFWRSDQPVNDTTRSDDLLLTVIAGGLAIIVSSQSGFGHHFRYAFPCLPFGFIFASSSFRPHASRPLRFCAVGALWLGCISSLSAWPLSHSYFNGCSKRLFRHPPLLESNLEWGEDLEMAAHWLHENPDKRPAFHVVMTDDLAQYMALDWQPAPARHRCRLVCRQPAANP